MSSHVSNANPAEHTANIKTQSRDFPWKGAAFMAIGTLGVVFGAPAHLLSGKAAIGVMAGSSAVTAVALSSILYGQKGDKSFKQASLHRPMRDIAHKIRADGVRTLWVKNQKVEGYYYSANWGVRSTLHGENLSQYGEYLEEQYSDLQYINLSNSWDKPPSSQEKKYVAIDIVLKGAIINHVVTLFIDNTKHTVEYYDSKGMTINDRSGASLVSTDQTLPDFVHQAISTFGDGKECLVWENTRKEQFDCHSCGVMVTQWKKERLGGTAAQDIRLNSKDEVAYREAIIPYLKPPRLGDQSPGGEDFDAGSIISFD